MTSKATIRPPWRRRTEPGWVLDGMPLGAGVAGSQRRGVAAAALLASLTGPPLLLLVLVGAPDVGGLVWWQWAAGLEYQSLPVEPLLVVIGLLAWGLWAYAALVTVLRVVVVVAARRGAGGVGRLLAFSDLVTVAPIRALVDAAVGVSLLASASHAVAPVPAIADPPTVVRTLEASVGWDRPPQPSGTALAADLAGQPPNQAMAAGPAAGVEVDCPPDARGGRLYTVMEGDSLWRIAEGELGDGRRWREIFAANQGRPMGNGHRLDDAGLILPGWQLLLPARPGLPHPPPTDPTPTAPSPPVRPDPPPPAPPAPSAPSITTSDRQGSPTLAPAPADDARGVGRKVVELPSGSMVGLSLAVGIAAALTIASLRRRRRRRPLWPPTPSPSRPSRHQPGETAWLLALAAARPSDPDSSDPKSQPDPAPVPQVPTPPRDPRDPTPARVAIGEQAGQEVTVDLAGHGPIGLLGPGAHGLARAAVVGLLAAGGPAAVEVLLVGNQLIPRAIGFPGLRRAATLAGALHVVEAELVQRARLLETEDTPDFSAHRREHPDDPLPALVLVADSVSLEQAGRLAAILAQGPRLGVGALLPGASAETGAQLLLDDRGRVQTAPWGLSDQQLHGVRACSLTEAEASELLQVLAQSRTDDPEPAESDHPGPPPAASPDPGEAGLLEEPGPVIAEPVSAEALVQVRLLGPFTIQTATGELRSGLRASARELLAYYLVHPDGATLEQAVDAMWPATDLGRERERFWTALGNLRSVLRTATGTTELKAIQRDGLRYRVDRELFAVDLWQFQAALATARRAELDPAVAAALA
jgi:hypothetical protein